MLKAKDARNETTDELLSRVQELKKDIFTLRSRRLDNKSQKTHEVGQKRKEIARVLTILREREGSKRT